MNSPRVIAVMAILLLTVLPAARAAAGKATSDLVPPAKRQATVEKAERLTLPPAPPEVAADLPHPFNPPDFNQPHPSEVAANTGPRAAPAQSSASGPPPPSGPAGDREILELLADRLTPSGTFIIGGKPLLVINNKRFEVGTRFTVTYDNQDYELELTSINRTTFALRYRNEEITRPIAARK
jgi:hypothetical protein